MTNKITQRPHHQGIDWDTWFNLAKSDPQAFEMERKALIESFIENAPKNIQDKLQSYQWSIDMNRSKLKTPEKCLVFLCKNMLDSLNNLQGECQNLISKITENALSETNPKFSITDAKLIEKTPALTQQKPKTVDQIIDCNDNIVRIDSKY